MVASLLIVVSGLPASGKTTVGRSLSSGLSLPFIDKDDILETLFDGLGCDDREQRERLSRTSDDVLFRVAEAADRAVVVNWWNHDTAPSRLSSIADRTIEVFCDCPVEEAATRFAARQRHPGHLDRLRTPEEHVASFTRLGESYRGPLRLPGTPIVTVDTGSGADTEATLATVRRLVAPMVG